MTAEIISSLLMLVGGITILTNIIVQVVKSITWDKIPTNLVALFVSEALTLALGGAYYRRFFDHADRWRNFGV